MSIAAQDKVVQLKSTGSTSYGTAPANSANLNLTAEVLDDTTFQTTGFRSRITGIKDWNVDMTIVFDPGSTMVTEIRKAWFNNNKLDMRYLPDGTQGFEGAGFVESFSLSGDIGGLETADVTLQPDSALSTVNLST